MFIIIDAPRCLHYDRFLLQRAGAEEMHSGSGMAPPIAGPLSDSAKWRGTCTVHFVSERRETNRHPVLIPVVLRGKDGQGREFFDRASIVSIDPRGARIHTRFHLVPGSLVTVEMPGEDRLRPFRVAWRGDPEGFYDGMVGLEIADRENSWEVETLRLRWAARNQ